MLLLQYIDELQDNKYSCISRKNGGCPPLQVDFLRRRTNETRLSIGVPEDKKCSTITEKNGDHPPLEMDPQTDKCSTTVEKHDDCSPSIPPEEIYQPEFDFVVKHPAEPLLRALRRCGVETLINDFLDTLFNLGTDLINLQDGELRESSPLIYAGHEPIRQDQAVKEVKVGLSEKFIFSWKSVLSSLLVTGWQL
ncbi:hypothetical protein L211DRAFT_409626 [Terfezia boudieri ATCC MYA-4762]|uniref:Uncharacterized protein n=1 Tax=Terfezia boudieri ATCC MYA-4762 TaxID=1051890 RepID=A0A3N4LJK1_9PEZI|nr:hypothetical protein L211DRAFT_409626 [Terfezia boudieri ATCC MYA-4762]